MALDFGFLAHRCLHVSDKDRSGHLLCLALPYVNISGFMSVRTMSAVTQILFMAHNEKLRTYYQ